jgi:putative transposase
MWKDLKLPDGRDRVVRHGHGPHRAIQTGVGPVEVRRAKGARQGRRGRRGENPLHLVDPAEVGAANEKSRCAVAGPLPAWVSTGDLQEALTALLGKDAPKS